MKKFCEACRTLDKSIAFCETFLIILCITSLIFGEIVIATFRQSSRINLSWIEQLLQYVVIWIGLLGASLASRTGEHISIEIVSRFTSPRFRRWLIAFTALVTTIIAIYLAIAALSFIQSEHREYLSSGGIQSRNYISLENIRRYRCPDAINQKRQEINSIQMKILGNIHKLSKAVNTKNQDSYEISQLQNTIQDNLQMIQSQDWSKDWLQEQWQNKWKLEWQKYWQEVGEKQDIKNVSSKSKVDWQNQWISQFWATQGKELAESAWINEGQKAWQEIEETSEFSELEFKKEWQNSWAGEIWQKEWQQIMETEWKEHGAKQCLENQLRQTWIEQQWKDTWQKEWQQIKEKHLEYSWKEGVCPICQKQKIAEPVTIPRWPLLIIIPIALFIIAWRFGLLTLEALFLGKNSTNLMTEEEKN